MANRTAVIMIHGIGEQVPMATLTGFIDAIWTHDPTLVDHDKPDPNTGGPRTANASWSKPDARNRSFELQVVTTESDKHDGRYDFFEYYWAHRVTGTTWEQVRAWLFGLMLRNPVTNVPRGVLPAWFAMWLAFFLFFYVSAVAALATAKEPIDVSGAYAGPIRATLALAAWIQAWENWQIALVWGGASLAIAFFLNIMVDVAGDVVRYVQATPKNIAIRQSIRENGVQLLETLMGIDERGQASPSAYDRIIVVGHSLGTIVGYDILTQAFGRHNTRVDANALPTASQANRVQMEAMLRDALAPKPKPFTIEAFQQLQHECREELNALGNPWIVSDFITLGSPLTHAEFLLAEDRAALEVAKQKRILPTCPPTLEYDRTTQSLHFTYRSGAVKNIGDSSKLDAPRVPHHAALFAYTRWTNIYSPLKLLLIGDIVSGPLSRVFGLARKDSSPVCGIRDVAVLPCAKNEGTQADRKWHFLTHLKYWDEKVAFNDTAEVVPFHIKALRDALALGRKP